MARQLWSLIRKELALWLKKPGQWIIVFIVPFLFIWIFTLVFGGSGGTPSVAIYLVNEDAGGAAELAVNALRNAPNLEIETLPDRDEADRQVGAGQRMAAVVIPAGFSEATLTSQGGRIEIIVDPARAEQAAIVSGLVSAAVGPVMIDAEVTRGIHQKLSGSVQALNPSGDSGQNAEKITQFLSAALKGVVSGQVREAIDHPLVQVEEVSASESNAPHPPTLVESLVPGYCLMFVFYLISMMATTVVEERETGSLRRLLALPARRGTLLLGKALPFFLIAAVQMTTLLIVSRYLFDMSLGAHPAALGVIILATSAAVAGMGILIAALVRSGGQAAGMTILVVLVMAAVSGSLFPGIRIPVLEYLTPHFWAIQGMQNVIARGMGLEGVTLQSGILLAGAAVFFAVGVMRFRFE